MKKRLLLVAGIAIVILTTFVLAVMQSKEYNIYIWDENGEYQDCYIDTDGNDVISLVSFSRVYGYAMVKLKAEGEGATEIDITFLNSEGEKVRKDTNMLFSVNSLGMLVYGNSNISGWFTVLMGETILVVLLAIYFILCFREHYKKNIYSFSSIMDLGFAIMFSAIGFIFVMLCLYVGYYFMDYATNTVLILSENMMNLLVLASVPFVLVFGLFMITTNISLIRHERFRIVNLLGIIISAILIFGIILTFYLKISSYYGSGDQKINYVLQFVVASLFSFFECMLMASAICCWYVARKKPAYDSDYVIVLGCKIRPDGSLTPLLKGRADGAVDYYNKRLEKTGKKTFIIPSGGKGTDEVVSEGEAIQNYLIKAGIPKEQIILEDKSTNTYENMTFSLAKINPENSDEKIYFSTTGYHVFRSGILATKAGINACGIGCKTRMYFWPNAFVREFIGMFVQLKKRLAIVVTVITVLSIGIALFFSNALTIY